jgi:hypothetical protein
MCSRSDVEHELIAEHAAIKRVLGEMVWVGVEDIDFSAKLCELSTLLDGHCGYQEDLLFEVVAETLPAEQLEALGSALQSFDSRALLAA